MCVTITIITKWYSAVPFILIIPFSQAYRQVSVFLSKLTVIHWILFKEFVLRNSEIYESHSPSFFSFLEKSSCGRLLQVFSIVELTKWVLIIIKCILYDLVPAQHRNVSQSPNATVRVPDLDKYCFQNVSFS